MNPKLKIRRPSLNPIDNNDPSFDESGEYARSGWPFLPTFQNQGSQISDLSYKKDIEESLLILFTTLPGERIAHPLYGCDLWQYMFKPINNSLITSMQNTIEQSIILFEPRINLLEVKVSADSLEPYILRIELAYSLRTESSRFNLTLPFYIMEGVA
ncbi:GPW/gp25 family protein [Aureibacter tunicatorum]|uniref:IraD/Gp25-like domain-containing protein n=1 Tax=Aureibacter tunicatorum TaxID=866807 RepID=A0AAE3XQ86_9BACT|nr:GPW/gp25 family protein [Aureibacter tunicatorum]MDR6240044.1 hypothetical protein [Aureibacter tunicatorum]BDD04516.1 hypothetical protein AUTU_19990 [Aureibacter tunicatorum]